jgi:hypothetical protein
MIEECATDSVEKTAENVSAAEGTNEEGAEAAPEKSVIRTFNQDVYNQISDSWEKAVKGAGPPFAGDLENPVYLRIIQAMRDFKPENFPNDEPAVAE